MKKSLVIKLIGLAMMTACSAAQAVTNFRAILTNDQEVPLGSIPNEGSSGLAIFVLNDAMTRLTYDVQLVGLDLRGVNALGVPGQTIPGDSTANDNVTRMHIHRNFAGLNGNIVFGMIDLSLALRDDNAPNDLMIDVPNLHITGAWDLLEGSQVVNQVTTLANELNNLLAGGLYLNFHTFDHPGGEIRGQILKVPEPGSLALLGIGALGLLGTALRRRA